LRVIDVVKSMQADVHAPLRDQPHQAWMMVEQVSGYEEGRFASAPFGQLDDALQIPNDSLIAEPESLQKHEQAGKNDLLSF
jgi:hypothetical protein